VPQLISLHPFKQHSAFVTEQFPADAAGFAGSQKIAPRKSLPQWYLSRIDALPNVETRVSKHQRQAT